MLLIKKTIYSTPYQDFSYVIKFLREAALDPKGQINKNNNLPTFKVILDYCAFVNAAKNGKKVLVQIELQARFDEENNIEFRRTIRSSWVQLIFGIPGLKVHSKICIIERQHDKKNRRYGFISTGNFNESTQDLYRLYLVYHQPKNT